MECDECGKAMHEVYVGKIEGKEFLFCSEECRTIFADGVRSIGHAMGIVPGVMTLV